MVAERGQKRMLYYMKRRGAGGNGGNGSKWLRREKRLAIYLRDGLACAWCGASAEEGASLGLDHLTCRVNGGSNEATNLVTACSRCNTSRGSRIVAEFAVAVASYLGIDAAMILAHVEATSRRPLDVSAAKRLITLRGGFTAALCS